MGSKSHDGSQREGIETTVQKCNKEERIKTRWFSEAGKPHRNTETESSEGILQICEVGKGRLTRIISIGNKIKNTY